MLLGPCPVFSFQSHVLLWAINSQLVEYNVTFSTHTHILCVIMECDMPDILELGGYVNQRLDVNLTSSYIQ